MTLIEWIKTHLTYVALLLIITIISVLVIGVIVAPDLFYDQFIWKYFWGQIVTDAGGEPVHNGVYAYESYNIVNEITYGIFVITTLFGIYKLFKRLKISLDWQFFMALMPFIIYGPLARTLEDAEYFAEPFVYWFITPLIYVQITLVVLGYILLGHYALKVDNQKKALSYIVGLTAVIIVGYWIIWFTEVAYGQYLIDPIIMTLLISASLLPIIYQYFRSKISINGVVFSGGILLTLPALYLTGLWIVGEQWATSNGVRFDVFVLIFVLISLITLAVYLVGHYWRKNESIAVLKHPLNLTMIAGHMIDGITSWVSIFDPFRMGIPLYVEKHPASDFLLQIWPPLFPIVKFLLIILIIYVFDILYKDDLAQYGQLKNLLKIGIIILGFSPGVRDLLRVTMGV